MDFTPLIHTDETLLSGLHGFGNISWLILTHHQHTVPPSWQSDHSLILLDLTVFSQISVSVPVPVPVPVPAFRVFHLPHRNPHPTSTSQPNSTRSSQQPSASSASGKRNDNVSKELPPSGRAAQQQTSAASRGKGNQSRSVYL